MLQATSFLPPTLPDYLDLERSEQVGALLEPLVQRILAALLEQPSSVGELSRRLGLVLGAVHHRTVRLERLGLLRVVERRKRRGRAVKLYGPTALLGWRFPFSLSNAESFEDLAMLYMQQHGREFWRNVAAQLEGELWIQYGRHGSRQVGFDVETHTLALENPVLEHTLAGWTRLDLTPEQATRFAQDLEWLCSRYAASPVSLDTTPHLLGLFLTQVLER